MLFKKKRGRQIGGEKRRQREAGDKKIGPSGFLSALSEKI
jgi:hypothetical protein